MKKSTEFTVNRATWLRGDANKSALLDVEGRMCCMGFYAEACGITRDRILEVGNIRDVAFEDPEYRALESDVVFGGHSMYSAIPADENVYNINDRSDIDDVTREGMLTEVLAARGVTVHFVD